MAFHHYLLYEKIITKQEIDTYFEDEENGKVALLWMNGFLCSIIFVSVVKRQRWRLCKYISCFKKKKKKKKRGKKKKKKQQKNKKLDMVFYAQ